MKEISREKRKAVKKKTDPPGSVPYFYSVLIASRAERFMALFAGK